MEHEYKGYTVVGDKQYGYKEIKPIGKGSVPLSLRGQFTTVNFAHRAIDAYLSEKSSKEA